MSAPPFDDAPSTIEQEDRPIPTATSHGVAPAATAAQPATLRITPTQALPPDVANGVYNQVIATEPVREIPYRWVQLVRPGGELVVSWHNPFAGPVRARLSVSEDGRAAGSFVEWSGCPEGDEHAGVITEAESAVPWYRTTTSLDPHAVWSDPAALFALGIRLPRLRWAQTGSRYVGSPRTDAALTDAGSTETVNAVASNLPDPTTDSTPLSAKDDRTGSGPSRYWIHDEASCACARNLPSGEIQVEQHGPRLLWREVEAAYKWWEEQDHPAFDRFGISVTSFGQFAWLGHRCSGRIWRI